MQEKVLELFESKGIPRELVEFREDKESSRWYSSVDCFVGGTNTQISWKQAEQEGGTVFALAGDTYTGDSDYTFRRIEQKTETPSFKSLKKRVKRELFLGLLKRVKELEEKIVELEYAPGGNIARSAQEHFESLSMKQ
ncbi:hypothetical protein A9K97_gp438 [Tokyovirus A1]|uniref:hypothetical protein n=1 Tax=Tokyovirus A1 TaxID=1826170 RepID=UPI0007A962AD|nr:hypothetical protein A9K97_gp438 [Tokyovirus A1]BAU79913.1 hypothetical protein [Tokyovirus A1]